MSKCVYLASMGVQINHTVGGQNEDFCFQNAYLTVMPVETWTTKQRKNCENLYVCPSKRNGIHGKFNKIAFGCKFCRICHLGRLFAIIIDVLSGGKFAIIFEFNRKFHWFCILA